MSASDEWAFLDRRIVMVSRFPPAEDGIARYAGQLLDVVREGREILRLGIPLGGGDRVVALWGGLRPLRIAWHSRGFEHVVVHYHPHYYVRGGFLSRVASYLALGAVVRLRPTTFIVHEPEDPRPVEIGRRGRAMFAIEEAARRILWSRAAGLVFHSEWERQRFGDRFPGRRGRAERVVSHGAFFTPSAGMSREAARHRLGLTGGGRLLVCIGFLSPHKGFDRALEAFARAGVRDVELHVVGTAIRPMPDVAEHIGRLRTLVERTPGAHLHETYVTDEEFDLWLRAADAVLTPYRTAASSSVLARAHLLGTPVITSAAGGMGEQAAPDDFVVNDDEKLVEAIRRATVL